MRICVPCGSPGGPEAPITDGFEESDMYDYYEVASDGRFEHVAQTRQCVGGCADPVDTIISRGVEAVIVTSLHPSTLFRLAKGGVRIFLTKNPSVRATLDAFASGQLEEVGMEEFSKMEKAEGEKV